MGKVKRARQKYKASVKQSAEVSVDDSTSIPPPDVENNVFSGINFSALKNKLQPDDLQSLRSFKSIKSRLGIDKQITKKDKLKLRKDMLKNKIDVIKEEAKALKQKKKRKNTAIIGDLQPMTEALKSLLKPIDSPLTAPKNIETRKPKKAFDKTKVRHAKLRKEVMLYKRVLKHPEFKKDPKTIIAEHIQAMVDRDKNIL